MSVIEQPREMQASIRLTILIEPDELDGGFVGSCVELPGCFSQGETTEELFENMKDAIRAVLIARLQDDDQANGQFDDEKKLVVG